MRLKYAWVLFIPLLLVPSILAAQETSSESNLELSRRFEVLSTNRYSTLNKELNQAVAAGYAVIMGNTVRKILVLEKQPEGAPRREFKVVENLSRDLREVAKDGFRLIPATVAAKTGMLSIQSAGVVERTPDSHERFEYRVLKTRRTSSLEKNINEAAAQGYRAIALATNTSRDGSLSGKSHIAIMERPAGVTAQSPAGSATGAPAYLLLAAYDSSTLQKELDNAAKKGFCVLLGAGGDENTLLLQKCRADASTPEYLVVATTKSGTFEKEINEAANRGYRPLPLTIAPVRKTIFLLPQHGPDWSETTIVMEKANAPSPAPTYLVIGTRRVSTFIKELADAEQNDFEMMGVLLSSYTENVALLAKTSSAHVRRQLGPQARMLLGTAGNYAQATTHFTYVQSTIASGLNGPFGVAVDGGGNIYIADTFNHRVLKETLQSGGTYAQRTIASGLDHPIGVAVDGNGNVYIADTFNNRVLKETLQPGGNYTQSTIISGSNQLIGVAVDGNGNIYIANTSRRRVLKETPQPGGKYAQSTIAKGLNGPFGVAVDDSGNVYIAETRHNRVLKETLQPGGRYTQSTIGSGLNGPNGVAVDSSGNVYIADNLNDRVLRETLQPGGTYAQSTIGSGLSRPCGVAVDGGGNVYISDAGNNRVLKMRVESQGR